MFDHSECVSLSVSVCAVMFCRLVVDVPLESRTNVQDVPGSIKNKLVLLVQEETIKNCEHLMGFFLYCLLFND